MKKVIGLKNRFFGRIRELIAPLRRDGSRWLVMLLGIAMIGLGALVPGTHSQAIAVLVIAGTGVFVIGALLPRFKEAEIGLKGFRLTFGEKAEAAPWLKAEESTLGRIAELVLPDTGTAQQVVEETVEAIQAYNDPIPTKERPTTTLRTLVSFLERANEGLWIDGYLPPASPDSGIEALQLVEFPDRMAYVLRNQGIQEQEVSKILQRTPEEIEKARQEVRSAISPYVEGRRKSSDV